MVSKKEILSRITPKNDLVFKKIFGAKGNELLPDFYGGKLSRLDVKAKLNDGTIVNIEVQTNMSGYSDSRSLAYWSKLYLEQIVYGYLMGRFIIFVNIIRSGF